jgi:hypothetical protein
MFALCGNQTRDLLRSRRLFPTLDQIGRLLLLLLKLVKIIGVRVEIYYYIFGNAFGDTVMLYKQSDYVWSEAHL